MLLKLLIIIYILTTTLLFICNLFNKRKIKKILATIDVNQKMSLDDSDLMPILKFDNADMQKENVAKTKFIALQRVLFISLLLSGAHSLIVITLCTPIWTAMFERGALIGISWLIGFIYVVHFISNETFMYGLHKMHKIVNFSYGYNVTGKSLFSTHPMAGSKYFHESGDVDDHIEVVLMNLKYGNSRSIF